MHSTFKLLKSLGAVQVCKLSRQQIKGMVDELGEEQLKLILDALDNPTIAPESLWFFSPAFCIKASDDAYCTFNRSTGGPKLDLTTDEIKAGHYRPTGRLFLYNQEDKCIDGKHGYKAIALSGKTVCVQIKVNVPDAELEIQVTKKADTHAQHLLRTLDARSVEIFGSQSQFQKLVAVINYAMDPFSPRKPTTIISARRMREIAKIILPKALLLLPGQPSNREAPGMTRNVNNAAMLIASYHLTDAQLDRAVNVYYGEATSIPGHKIMAELHDYIPDIYDKMAGKHEVKVCQHVFMNMLHAFDAIKNGEGDTTQLIDWDEHNTAMAEMKKNGFPIWWPDNVLTSVPEFWRLAVVKTN